MVIGGGGRGAISGRAGIFDVKIDEVDGRGGGGAIAKGEGAESAGLNIGMAGFDPGAASSGPEAITEVPGPGAGSGLVANADDPRTGGSVGVGGGFSDSS